MYAIVKTGGKQYRVAVGDVLRVEKLTAQAGDEVALPAVLLVDGESVTHDATALASVAVTAEVLAQTKGPKIRIHKYKNKTGYHRRLGHRQPLTELKVTDIDDGTPKKAPAKKAAPAKAEKAAAKPATTEKPADTAGDEK